MKTGKSLIESVSIWCPHCNQFVEGPKSGSSVLDSEEYQALPQVLICSDCGEKFRKPQVKL